MDIVVTAAATSNREAIPADTYVGRCVEMIQIGTLTKTFEGKQKEVPTVRLSWELPDYKVEYDGKEEPAMIGEEFTLSLHEKAGLRKVLKSWRGRDFTDAELKGFSMKNLLGAPCMLSVAHATKGDKTYANVATVSKLMAKMVCPDQVNTSRILAYGEDFDWAVFDALPNWIKDKMKTTPEFIKQAAGRKLSTAPTPANATTTEPDDNDLPF